MLLINPTRSDWEQYGSKAPDKLWGEENEERMTEYITTEEECRSKCEGKVCLRCGEPLSPIETVDNFDHPTFWVACLNCSIFSPGTTKAIYMIAKNISEDYRNISMDTLCAIANRVLHDARQCDEEVNEEEV